MGGSWRLGNRSVQEGIGPATPAEGAVISISPRRLRVTGFAVFTAGLLVASSFPFGASPVEAATCTASQLRPTLRDITVDQGVGSYGKLIRGKQAIVRLYLTRPTGCTTVTGQQVIPTGAVLRVTSPSPGGTTFSFGAPYRPLSGKLPAAIQADGQADPLFQVPGSTFQPLSTTGEFQVTLTATVTYTRKSGGVTTTGLTRDFTMFGGLPITRTVEKRTNALRILVVPMGDASLPYETQFRDAERQAVIRGMNTLARVLPVPDGTGDLHGTTGGIRYTINAGILDIGPSGLDLLDAQGDWCGTDSRFNAIKGPLGAILHDWNNENPGATADRVLSVVGAGISKPSGPGSACDEGRAAVPRPDLPAVAAYVRAIPDGTTPSMTGALMVMELAHTFGIVDPRESGRTLPGTYHSLNTQADVTDPDRGYNLTTRQYIADDRSGLKLTSGWHDGNVLLEKNDWEYLACALGGESTTLCQIPADGIAGTSEGIAAGPMFVLTGTTDGSSDDCTANAGTCIVESYYNGIGDGEDGAAETLQDPGSDYRLLYLDASGDVLNSDGVAPPDDGFGVPVSVAETEHGSHGGSGEGDPPRFLFSIAFPFTHPNATQKIRLVFDPEDAPATVLYERDRTAAPIITRLSTPLSQSRIAFAWDDPADDGGADTGSDIYSMNPDGSNVQRLTSSDDDDTQPRVSPDGRMVAFTREPAGGGDTEIFLIWENLAACDEAAICSGASAFPDETDLTNDPTHDDANPDWTPDGERLIYDSRISAGDRDLRWLTYTDYFGNSARWFNGTVTSPLEPAGDTLRLGIDPTQTTIPVTGQRLPSEGPYIAQVESERVQVTGNFFGTTLDVVRGVDGTTAVAHPANTPITVVSQPARDESQPVWSSDGLAIAFTRGSLDGTHTDVAIASVETELTYDGSSRGRTDALAMLAPADAASGSGNPAGQQDAFDPDWVRGNDKLVFATNWDGDNEIYTYDFAEEQLERLTNDPADDRFPSVDEASGRILFRSDRDGGTDRVFRMNADGGNVTAIPDDPAAQRGSDPAWYPRDPQSRILFVRDNTLVVGLYDIWTMNPDGSDAQALTTGGIANADPRWSPDASRIAFSGYLDSWGRHDVYTMGTDGFDTINLTWDLVADGTLPCPDITPPAEPPASSCQAGGPVWSPDGRRIAFAYGGDGQIWIVDADGGGHAVRVTNETDSIRSLAWSPDGTRIAYSLTSGPCCIQDQHIWTIHPDGTGRTQITTGATDDFDPAWSPDSTTLAIARRASGAAGSGIVSIDAITGAVVRTYATAVFAGTNYSRPSWSPDGRQLSFSFDQPDPGCFFNCANRTVITIDADGEAFVQRSVDPRVSSPDWSPGEDTVYLSGVIDGDPADALADLYYDCGDGGPVFPIAVAVPPVSVDGAIASFQANFDPAFACGDGTPRLSARVNDGFSISEVSEPEPFLSDEKAPAVGIAGPRVGAIIGPFDPLPLVADTKDPEDGALAGSTYTWQVDGVTVEPDPGAPADAGQTPHSFDAQPPAGYWRLGWHTVRLTVTDTDTPPNTSVVTQRFRVVADFSWVAPTRAQPRINRATAGDEVAISFSLGGDVGMDIMPRGSPKAQRYICGDSSRLVAGTDWFTRPFGAAGLTYDAQSQVYTYTWATRPEWGEGNLGCRQFQLLLRGGTLHRADFVLAPP